MPCPRLDCVCLPLRNDANGSQAEDLEVDMKTTMSCRRWTHEFVTIALMIGGVILTAAAVHAACNCTCDPLVPSNQQINASMMNESGASPTHYVSAGGPGGAAREIRHGNLFSSGITISHVCIALQSPSGQPGELANVQIYQPDPDPLNFNLPGALMYTQQFQISPGFNGHQIVQLVTPQVMMANYWLVVAYPTAQPAIGHQGTRPRTQGNSAVYIDGPPSPGFTPGWKYYDDLGGPGGTAGYLGNAPIIRPLNIGPSGSVCPYDQQCCTTVCNLEPGCCIVWSPLCEQLAFQNCFTGGCDACPPQGISEGEACDTDINGGCDTNGAFSTLSCNTVVCGTLWRHSITGIPDTDWYLIDVVDPLSVDQDQRLVVLAVAELGLDFAEQLVDGARAVAGDSLLIELALRLDVVEQILPGDDDFL